MSSAIKSGCNRQCTNNYSIFCAINYVKVKHIIAETNLLKTTTVTNR